MRWLPLVLALSCVAPAFAGPGSAPHFARGAAPFVAVPSIALGAGWLLLGVAFQMPRVEADRGGCWAGAWALIPAVLSVVPWADARVPLFLGLAYVYALFVVIWVAWDEEWLGRPKTLLLLLAGASLVCVAGGALGWALRADANECLANQRELGFALEAYAADNRGAYPERLPAGAPRCLPSLPEVAQLRASVYNLRSEPYGYARAPRAFTVWCGTANHRGIGLPPGYPQYSSTNREILSGEPQP